MRRCPHGKAVIQLLKSLASGSGCVLPHVGLVENGFHNVNNWLLKPETQNTTLYSGSFGSGVDEERS